MRIAILGAGNGGQSTAARCGHAGHSVRLYDRFAEVVEPLASLGRVRAGGAVEETGPIEMATTDMGRAIEGADLILVSVPGFAHNYIASELAGVLSGHETVVLHPGGFGGALEVRKKWSDLGVPAGVRLAETNTLAYACRVVKPGTVHIGGVKRAFSVAALGASRTPGVLRLLKQVFPNVEPAGSVLETSFDNMNPVAHPVVAVLNTGSMDGGDFDFYADGLTPSVVRAMEALDAERMEVAGALGIPARTHRAWLERSYGIVGSDTMDTERQLASNVMSGIGVPGGMHGRYVTEDVPLGLVPMTHLARIAAVDTPVVDAVITLAGAATGRDYRHDGRSPADMGIDSMDVQQILEVVA